MNKRSFFLLICTLLALLAILLSCPTSQVKKTDEPIFITGPVAETDYQFVPADNPNLKYTGRIDDANPTAPVIIWEGTEIRFRFSGRSLGIIFSNLTGQNYFNIIIDEKVEILRLQPGNHQVYMLNRKLKSGPHEAAVFKRTEGTMSTAIFNGFLVEKKATISPRPEALPLKIEFIGDSITAGACNEDIGSDQWSSLATHNNYLSYGAIASRMLGAEYVNISISGTGICYSWNPLLIPETFDKLYPSPKSAPCDTSKWKPDIVVINIGQNDAGYPQSKGLDFPADFTPRYVSFVKSVRSLYPDAGIVCAIGGMTGYKSSPGLRKALKAAIDELKSDPKIFSYIFEAYSVNHPRVDLHRLLADELVAFLKTEVLGK